MKTHVLALEHPSDVDSLILSPHFHAGAYPGFSEGGGGGCRDPPKKLTSQTSARVS